MQTHSKLICLTILLLLFTNNSFGQSNKVYCNAYKYLQSEYKNANIKVTDTVIYIDLKYFYEELANEWSKGKNETSAFLDSVDLANSNYEENNLCLKKLGTKGEGEKVIYFSKPYKNMLAVDVLNKKDKFNLSYDVQALFNTGTKYLFIFDNKFRIKKVLKKEFQYN